MGEKAIQRIVRGSFLFPLLLAGCGGFYPEVNTLKDSPPDRVLLVGKASLTPHLRPEEQNIELHSADVMGYADAIRGRMIVYLSRQPSEPAKTSEAINPKLEETFFFSIPRECRYMPLGTITIKLVTHLSHTPGAPMSSATMTSDESEILVPGLEFGIQDNDRAVYIGTLKLHRDEFNSITKVEILDEYGSAAADFTKKFGKGSSLRKALAKPLKVKKSH